MEFLSKQNPIENLGDDSFWKYDHFMTPYWNLSDFAKLKLPGHVRAWNHNRTRIRKEQKTIALK